MRKVNNITNNFTILDEFNLLVERIDDSNFVLYELNNGGVIPEVSNDEYQNFSDEKKKKRKCFNCY